MSYTNHIYHIVFGTKGRLPMISADIRPRFHQYLGGIVRGLGGIALAIGGVEDHVHLLVKLKPTINFSDFLRDLKSNSSRWAKANGIRKFAWQRRYGSFTVSESQIVKVTNTSVNRKAIIVGLILNLSLKCCCRAMELQSTILCGKSKLLSVARNAGWRIRCTISTRLRM